MRLDENAIRFFWDRAERVQAHGFEIGFESRAAMERLLPPIEAALRLLEATDGRTAAAIRVAMPRLLVRSVPGYLARFYREMQLCELRSEYVGHGSTTPARLVLTIVHEGMHARIYARGLHGGRLGLVREERLASMAELQIAKKLPGAGELVERVMRDVASVAATYSKSQIRRRELIAAAQLGAPWWLVRSVAKLQGVDLRDPERVDPYASGAHARRLRAGNRGSGLRRSLLLRPTRRLRNCVIVLWIVICVSASLLLPSSATVWAVLALIVGTIAISSSWNSDDS